MSPAVAPFVASRGPVIDAGAVTLRTPTPEQSEAIHALVAEHRVTGHLLPRTLDDIRAHSHRFVVAMLGDEVIACADLAPLSRSVAEIRSLVVDTEARSAGIGRRLVDELARRATAAGFEKLCAFTHSPTYFVQMGFSIVPHVWLPEKIAMDCSSCPHFRQCGQYAVMLPLGHARHSCVPLASLHG